MGPHGAAYLEYGLGYHSLLKLACTFCRVVEYGRYLYLSSHQLNCIARALGPYL